MNRASRSAPHPGSVHARPHPGAAERSPLHPPSSRPPPVRNGHDRARLQRKPATNPGSHGVISLGTVLRRANRPLSGAMLRTPAARTQRHRLSRIAMPRHQPARRANDPIFVHPVAGARLGSPATVRRYRTTAAQCLGVRGIAAAPGPRAAWGSGCGHSSRRVDRRCASGASTRSATCPARASTADGRRCDGIGA
jgi:hypothetical protein